jgi:Helix-turn-helix domain
VPDKGKRGSGAPAAKSVLTLRKGFGRLREMEATFDQAELFPVLERKAKRKGFLHELMEANEEHGVLMAPSWVAHVLAVSRQRIYQLIEKQQLATVKVCGRVMVPVAAIEAYLAEERKNGRPVKEPTLRQAMRFGVAEALQK